MEWKSSYHIDYNNESEKPIETPLPTPTESSIPSEVPLPIPTETNAVDELIEFTAPLGLDELLDENGYLTDEGLLSLETLPFDEDKFTETVRKEEKKEQLQETNKEKSGNKRNKENKGQEKAFNSEQKYESIEYSGTFNENTDIIITPTTTGVKEDIVLYEVPKETEFSYELTVEKVVPLLREDGNLFFVDLEKNLLVCTIPSPFMYDSAEEFVESYEIKVKLERTGENTYKYTLVPDRNFIEDENTVYPVTIDPFICSPVGWIADTFIAERYSNNNYYADPALKIGNSSTFNRSRGLIKLLYWPSELAGNTITQAEFCAYQDYNGSSSPSMDIHNVIDGWDQTTVRWSNQPRIDGTIISQRTV